MKSFLPLSLLAAASLLSPGCQSTQNHSDPWASAPWLNNQSQPAPLDVPPHSPTPNQNPTTSNTGYTHNPTRSEAFAKPLGNRPQTGQTFSSPLSRKKTK